MLHILGFCFLFGKDRVEIAFLYVSLAGLELTVPNMLTVNLQLLLPFLLHHYCVVGLQAYSTVLATFDRGFTGI